jgi:glycosyltransferase involved in cell wall biosynthesis
MPLHCCLLQPNLDEALHGLHILVNCNSVFFSADVAARKGALMRILFLHNNFPAQYKRIVSYLDSKHKKVEMYAATLKSNKQKTPVKKTVFFEPHREPSKNTHPALIYSERAVIQGQALYKALLPSKKAGFKPDIIMSHSGWGSSLFLKDLFPDAKLLSYFEWYYSTQNSDATYLTTGPIKADPNNDMRIRMKNTPILHDLAAMDHGQCPTYFQHDKLPLKFQDNVSVLHDGVDTDFFRPTVGAKVKVGGFTFSADDEIITYVARGMEEYRGFPQFMEVVYKLQQQRPNLQVVILGNDRVAYGAPRSDGKTWKEAILEKYNFDLSRIHFMGLQPLPVFRGLMQITRAHVYLTVPFVLSWSLMEAMGAGALIVGSDTEPVREVVTGGENGVLVPFFDTDAISKKLCHILDNKAEYQPLRAKARQTIEESYSTNDLVPKYWELIKSVANGSHK